MSSCFSSHISCRLFGQLSVYWRLISSWLLPKLCSEFQTRSPDAHLVVHLVYLKDTLNSLCTKLPKSGPLPLILMSVHGAIISLSYTRNHPSDSLLSSPSHYILSQSHYQVLPILPPQYFLNAKFPYPHLYPHTHHLSNYHPSSGPLKSSPFVPPIFLKLPPTMQQPECFEAHILSVGPHCSQDKDQSSSHGSQPMHGLAPWSPTHLAPAIAVFFWFHVLYQKAFAHAAPCV